MASSSKLPQNSSIGTGGSTRNLICYCNEVAVIRTTKNGVNAGKKFFGCPNWPGPSACKFFEWVMEECCIKRVPIYNDLEVKILEKDIEIDELEMKNRNLEEKIKKLHMKKESAEEELQEIKNELCHTRIELMNCARSEKILSTMLVFSWLMFAALALLLR
ncbi:uncharacterized protein [Spinacia oleracea]|uniref:GRF-type domain-containing protein n=1 Tax=Spinacia oleracea TaxID=3562 RepID=A0ABM3R6W7_SPIOL|nr:uncharacterized protein LOC130466781 [Spinacia oleracea]